MTRFYLSRRIFETFSEIENFKLMVDRFKTFDIILSPRPRDEFEFTRNATLRLRSIFLNATRVRLHNLKTEGVPAHIQFS